MKTTKEALAEVQTQKTRRNLVVIAATLIEVEAHMTLARAHLLRGDDSKFWDALLKGRSLAHDIVAGLLHPDHEASAQYFLAAEPPKKAKKKRR